MQMRILQELSYSIIFSNLLTQDPLPYLTPLFKLGSLLVLGSLDPAGEGVVCREHGCQVVTPLGERTRWEVLEGDCVIPSSHILLGDLGSST